MLKRKEQLRIDLVNSGITPGNAYYKMFNNIDGIIHFLTDFPALGIEIVVRKSDFVNYKIMKETDNYFWQFLNFLQQFQFLNIKKVEKKKDGRKYYYVLITPGSFLYHSQVSDISSDPDIPF